MPAGSERIGLHDIQASADTREIALQRVGVKDIAVPLRVQTRGGGFQAVQATCALTVGLPKEFKGTHMSRFVEILAEWQRRNMSGACVEDLVREIRDRLDAPAAGALIRFRYFVDKAAPATGAVAPTDLDCSFEGDIALDGTYRFTLGVAVPVTTLCPCSKAISRYGAHNQRSLITARVRCRTGTCTWIEDLAAALEARASCPVYPLLKREDEKVVTEQAYENPKFVEDVLRDCILYLRSLSGIEWFSLEVENFESIHNHNAWATHEEWVG
ncbi:MAG: GTP cyclohydrolase I FolE2 [Candidatus Sericytochromatia bacterium]|nr:GTP cyclohydrolase I FolE2 [Candidatus Tanganyikabacteria bacterium]